MAKNQIGLGPRLPMNATCRDALGQQAKVSTQRQSDRSNASRVCVAILHRKPDQTRADDKSAKLPILRPQLSPTRPARPHSRARNDVDSAGLIALFAESFPV
jgi:hypothetical protein